MKKWSSILITILVLSGCTIPSRAPEKIDIEHVLSDFFDTAWDDYTLYQKGLISSEQAATDFLSSATVYHLDVHITDCTLLEGREEVLYTNRENEPLDDIYFRLFPNIAGGSATVSRVAVNDQDTEPVYELNRSALLITLPVPLQPGEQTTIQMDFQVEVPQEMGGKYGLFGYLDSVLVLDEFYPVIPVYDDEGWNIEIPPSHGDVTYYDSSFYLVRVTAPAALKIAASGIEIGSARQDDSQTILFAAGPARDFYIAASENYVVISDTVGETTVNSYAFSEQKEGAKLALKIGINALKNFNTRFGVYPYTEFDIVSTPMKAKGMEYPGIVAISQKLYDLDATVSGLPSNVMLESVLAHEVAHQWFYSVVGNDQIDEPWLDEAIAQYATGLYYLNVYGEAAAKDYCSSWDDLWERIDRATIPIGLSSETYTSDEYVPIIYGRGPLFIAALAEKMGSEAFDQFLRDYYESSKWGIGTGDVFRYYAEHHCQCDLSVLFEEWVYEPLDSDIHLRLQCYTCNKEVK